MAVPSEKRKPHPALKTSLALLCAVPQHHHGQCTDGGCAHPAGKATSSPKNLCGIAVSPPRPVPQCPELLPGVGVPHDDTGVVGSGDEESRVWGEVTGHHAALVALQPPDECVGSHAPQQRLQGLGRGSGWEHPKV